MPQNRWKYPDGSVTIKLYEPFPAGESLLLKLEDKTMDYNKAALEMHETHKGKVGIVSKVEVATRDDLSTAYTPGVAEPCRKIKENPDDVYKYTFKGNMVAVVSNGTAVLGLGDIGPEAGLPVMEGKAVPCGSSCSAKQKARFRAFCRKDRLWRGAHIIARAAPAALWRKWPPA